MKEIRFSKIYCNTYLLFHGCAFVLEIFLAVYFLYRVTIAKNIPAILFGFFMTTIFLLTAKAVFTDIVFFVRFYGLGVSLLDDKLILSMDNRECQIPIGKDVNVMYCMVGWLIIWPSGDKNKMILLRKGFFLEKSRRELRQYFEINMNYISAKEEKKKTLKSFHVNVFNPLKYIKWPISCVNSNEKP